jgi:hypothetical protein
MIPNDESDKGGVGWKARHTDPDSLNPAILALPSEFLHTNPTDAWHTDPATTPLGPLVAPRQS